MNKQISIVPVTVQHADDLASLVQQNIEHLRTYLPAVAGLATAAAAEAHLRAAAERAAQGEVFEWHIFAGAALCGSIRLKDIDEDDRKAKIGYFLGSQFQGRGIATSSVRAILTYSFEVLRLNRIELQCAAGNLQSIALAERLGFNREGVLREGEFLHGAFVDLHIYGMLQADFVTASPARQAPDHHVVLQGR